jgi:Holliday junction DNA helicase RuvA
MISFIEGVVESSTPLEVVLNCQGVGYQVHIPITTAEKIPGIGQGVRLHIHPVYREDSQALYGFASRDERDFFHLVTSKVSGIGPKIGLNLMSRLSFQMLQEAIARGDAALLSKCPGIGKKTAERICIELTHRANDRRIFATGAYQGQGWFAGTANWLDSPKPRFAGG